MTGVASPSAPLGQALIAEQLRHLDASPGVYRMLDAKGDVLYVGKAINLRSRLSSYFQDIANLHPRTATMVATGSSVEWTVVKNEVGGSCLASPASTTCWGSKRVT